MAAGVCSVPRGFWPNGKSFGYSPTSCQRKSGPAAKRKSRRIGEHPARGRIVVFLASEHRVPKNNAASLVYLVISFFIVIISSRAANSFAYYGSVLFTTVLFQSHDECHGGFSSNATMAAGCQPLTRDDYFHLLSATMAEFPGLIVTIFIIEWLGRKKTMCLEFGIFAVCTYLLLFCLDRLVYFIL